ncbi:MAG TPA: methyltransferase domain-containing protein [Streptosporangiaceae bacterium]
MTADALIKTLTGSGDLTRDEWARALRAVPRHLFVPDVAWAASHGRDGYRIDRRTDPQAWMAAAYADHPIITQVDDGAGDVGAGEGEFTSSLSAPGVVVDFLERLGVYDGHRVLEIGTGSGWTAALLAHRLGSDNVVSVEIDPELSARAAAALKEAGFSPRLVVGDGAAGWPQAAPYDRVHVTCGVTTVPYAWVEQTRPGGIIVLPWMPEYAGGHKLKLTVLPDGTAAGRFCGGCDYMMIRSQRSPGAVSLDGDVRESETAMDPRRIAWASWGADVAIAGMLPDVAGSISDHGGLFRMRLWTADSEALVTCSPDQPTMVRERGPRDLWQEVQDAFFAWVRLGEPGRDRFGLTVGQNGQRVWLDTPDNTI